MSDSTLRTWMRTQGMGIAAYVAYKLMNYARTYGDESAAKGQFLEVNEMKAVSVLTGINEFVFWWFFDQVFRHDDDIMANKRVASKIILGATFFYLSPIVLLSNANYADYAKYVYAVIFTMKCMVGSPWIRKLKLQTTEHAFLFLNFSLALVYGLISKQLLGRGR